MFLKFVGANYHHNTRCTIDWSILGVQIAQGLWDVQKMKKNKMKGNMNRGGSSEGSVCLPCEVVQKNFNFTYFSNQNMWAFVSLL